MAQLLYGTKLPAQRANAGASPGKLNICAIEADRYSTHRLLVGSLLSTVPGARDTAAFGKYLRLLT